MTKKAAAPGAPAAGKAVGVGAAAARAADGPALSDVPPPGFTVSPRELARLTEVREGW
jgi:hypothetical protein